MRVTRTRLLLGASALALAVGMGGSPAKAFDTVNWTWNKTVTQTDVITLLKQMEFYPTGDVQVEKLQIDIGNQRSTARLDTFVNNQPTAGGTGTLSGSVTFTGSYFQNSDINAAGETPFKNSIPSTNSFGDQYDSNGALTDKTPTKVTTTGDLAGANVSVTGGLSETDGQLNTPDNGAVAFTVDLSGIPVTVAASTPLDAVTQLPEVKVTATSVGNVDQIQSTVSTYVHAGQFQFGGFKGDTGLLLDPNVILGPGGNTYTTLAALLTLGGAAGVITPSSITANASAGSITNASADISAAAISNQESITVRPTYDPIALAVGDADANAQGFKETTNPRTSRLPLQTDLELIGDVTQFAYSNNSASATLTAQQVNNYANLRQLPAIGDPSQIGVGTTVPVANVSATSIGNSSSIQVGGTLPSKF